MNAFVTPLILQGQSIHQIYVNYADTLMCSEKTLYNYIDHGFFDARNIDLPRKVRYRPRKKEQEFKADRGCYVGRNYVDYQQFLLKHPNAHTVQMDSVIDTVGGKVLLAIHFPETSFMMAFLRDANTSQSVIDVFDYLYRKLGKDLFEKLFPGILTDRGSAFSNPKMIECELSCGIRRTNVFYCNPSSPYLLFGAPFCYLNHRFTPCVSFTNATFRFTVKQQILKDKLQELAELALEDDEKESE